MCRSDRLQCRMYFLIVPKICICLSNFSLERFIPSPRYFLIVYERSKYENCSESFRKMFAIFICIFSSFTKICVVNCPFHMFGVFEIFVGNFLSFWNIHK